MLTFTPMSGGIRSSTRIRWVLRKQSTICWGRTSRTARLLRNTRQLIVALYRRRHHHHRRRQILTRGQVRMIGEASAFGCIRSASIKAGLGIAARA